jgi:hypothetical protein
MKKMSFRSTEFAHEAARDNQATNTLEIKAEGWAFGQIDDMRAWVDGLAASGKISSATHFIAACALFTPAKTLKGFKDARKNHRSCAKLRAKLATRRRNHCAGSYEKRSDSIYKHRTSRP